MDRMSRVLFASLLTLTALGGLPAMLLAQAVFDQNIPPQLDEHTPPSTTDVETTDVETTDLEATDTGTGSGAAPKNAPATDANPPETTGPETTGPESVSQAAAPQLEASPRTLTLVSWGGRYARAQQTALLDSFARDQDKVQLLPYKGSLESLARVDAPWDLVDLEAAELRQACDQGLVAKLDFAQLGPDGAVLTPASLLTGSLHPCGLASHAWIWSFFAAQDKALDLRQLLSADAAPGKRGILRNPQGLLEMLTLARGVPAAQVYAALSEDDGVAQALQLLLPLGDALSWYDTAQDLESAMVAGDLVGGFGLSSSLIAGQGEASFVPLVSPLVYGLGYWAVASETPNRPAALAFLQHTLGQQAAQGMAETLGYGPSRLAYYDDLDTVPNLATAPDRLLLDASWWQSPAGIKAQAAFEAALR